MATPPEALQWAVRERRTRPLEDWYRRGKHHRPSSIPREDVKRDASCYRFVSDMIKMMLLEGAGMDWTVP
jgi:hypothetical protein